MISIPKLFHWIWLGSAPLPDQHRRWMDGWLALHPDWQQILWTDANRPPFINEAQFLAADTFSLKADVARYEVVYRHGGIYLDTDMECLRSIEPLLAGVEAFIASEDPASLKHLGTVILGATPRHPWLAELIAQLPAAMETGWGNLHRGGPAFAKALTIGRPDVTVFPEEFFRHDGRPPLEETYAIHHGTKSWDAVSQARYELKLRQLVTEDIEPIVPQDAQFILVNKGRVLELNGGRRAVPFPERDDQWTGYPADDATAINELERLRRSGAQFIVFPAPMFYWLDAYPGLKERLMTGGRCLVQNDRAIIFDLRS